MHDTVNSSLLPVFSGQALQWCNCVKTVYRTQMLARRTLPTSSRQSFSYPRSFTQARPSITVPDVATSRASAPRAASRSSAERSAPPRVHPKVSPANAKPAPAAVHDAARGPSRKAATWWLSQGWNDARHWTKAEGNIAPAPEECPSGKFYRLTMYRLPKATSRFHLDVTLYEAMFGDAAEVTVDFRCELDGVAVPITEHSNGRVASGSTSCHGTLTYSSARRQINVSQNCISSKYLDGKAHLGWVLDPCPPVPRLTAVLRSLSEEQRDVVAESARGGFQLGVSMTTRPDGVKVFDVASPTPQFVGRGIRGASVPKAVVMEAFVKPGLANMEAPTNPATGKKQYVFTACTVKAKLVLAGSAQPQSGVVYEASLKVRSNPDTDKYVHSELVGLDPLKNGLAGRRVVRWEKEPGADGILTLTFAE